MNGIAAREAQKQTELLERLVKEQARTNALLEAVLERNPPPRL